MVMTVIKFFLKLGGGDKDGFGRGGAQPPQGQSMLHATLNPIRVKGHVLGAFPGAALWQATSSDDQGIASAFKSFQKVPLDLQARRQ